MIRHVTAYDGSIENFFIQKPEVPLKPTTHYGIMKAACNMHINDYNASCTHDEMRSNLSLTVR